MNERIKELYNQALESKFDYGAGAGVKPGEYYSNYITVLNPEKFAELIVRECAQLARNTNLEYVEGGDSSVLLAAKHHILDHFGVEE